MNEEEKEDVKQNVEENKSDKKEVIENVKQNENNVSKDSKKEVTKDNKKKNIILFSAIGGVVLIALIVILCICLAGGKPSKKQAENLVEEYTKALENSDEYDILDLIDTKGYIIFNEEGEKSFNKKYKEKDDYIKRYLKKNDLDDIEEAEEKIYKSIKSKNYYKYSLKEISSIKKSSKCNKIVIIKAKVKAKSSYSTDTKTLRLYVIKVSGKYKIVGSEVV